MEDVERKKLFRVFKICSSNTNYFYVDFTKNVGYASMILHGYISRYKTFGDNPDRYKKYFYIIAKNNLSIDELNSFDNEEERDKYLEELKKDENCINTHNPNDEYVYNSNEITCNIQKVDKKKYLKKYYETNRNRYKERYNKNRDVILEKRKKNYVSQKKKKDIEE